MRDRASIAQKHAGDQSVERAFARLQMIGMLFVEREEGPAVLHDDFCVAADHGATEVVIDGLNERRHHAVPMPSARVRVWPL